MSEKDLIAENNRMRAGLNAHNLNVYEDIMVYIRLNYSSDDAETEEVLNDLLSHVLLAQKDGKQIESVTGNDYKSYADSIIQELPKRNVWKLSGVIAMIFLGISYSISYLADLVFKLIDGAPSTITINLGTEILYVMTIILTGIGIVFLMFHTMQYTLFKDWPSWKENGLVFLVGSGSFLIFILFSFLKDAVDIGPSFEMSLWLPVLLGVILMASGFTLLFKNVNNA